MKEILFKWLFPKKHEKMRSMEFDLELFELQKSHEQYYESSQDKKPSMADLMRDSIGLPMVDFINTDTEGYPTHFMAHMKPEERKVAVSKLHNIYKDELFMSVLDYWINMFGNHSIRKGSADITDSGRFGINGIAMIRKELEKASTEFTADMKPEEEYDEHEVI